MTGKPYNANSIKYVDGSLGIGTHSRDSELEKIANKPNRKGFLKKAMYIGLPIVVAGVAAYYLLTANPSIPETPKPIDYNPPAITAEVPKTPTDTAPAITTIDNKTNTETPKEKLTLEDFFPDNPEYFEVPTTEEIKSATAAHVNDWMTYALVLDYKTTSRKFPDVPKYIDDAGEELSGKWVDRALRAVKESNFEYEKVLALYVATDIWEYGGENNVPADVKADTIKWSREKAERYAKLSDSDKNDRINRIKRNLETILGSPYGSRKK